MQDEVVSAKRRPTSDREENCRSVDGDDQASGGQQQVHRTNTEQVSPVAILEFISSNLAFLMLHLTEYSPEFLLDMLLHIRLYPFVKPGHFLCRKIGRSTYIFVHIIKFKKLHNRTSILTVVLRLQYCSNLP